MCDGAERLAEFIDKYTPEIAALALRILERIRVRLPGVFELVYDNYNALAIGFSHSERLSDTVISIAIYPRWVSLFFFGGVELPDPDGLLNGTGNRTRHIVLNDVETLDLPGVQTLIECALARSGDPSNPGSPSRIVIKSVSERQRPRRKA